ncbi:MAG: class I SAM-dependent methyltransferase [Actinomycetia bacterium]|nr:class I SAM-dependent methyltransferase [Actinomycetes bacterium]
MSVFYEQTLKTLLESGGIERSWEVLAVCAGTRDRDVLTSAGFTRGVISNLDRDVAPDEFAPFSWERLDAEALDRPDDSVDVSVVHAGLHHCASPHRALAEMYRVARHGVLVFEARDSASMRAAVRLGVADAYEIEAVLDQEGRAGGHRNTAVPNHVYRWTERDVIKTVASIDPAVTPAVEFFHDVEVPTDRLSLSRRPLVRIGGRLVGLAGGVVARAFPKQGNRFAFHVDKRRAVGHPWLVEQDESMVLDPSWIEPRFRARGSAQSPTAGRRWGRQNN